MEEVATKDLLEQVLSQEDSEKAEVILELADRCNQSELDCLEVTAKLLDAMGSRKPARRHQAIFAIEIFVKNCEMIFHKSLLKEKFCTLALKILEKRRGKKSFLNMMVAKDEKIQMEIEQKLLFLIQLWYDTFMLHEDDFKQIISVYKTLRKDGVVFPKRSSSDQYLIKFSGKKSPIFEVIEAGRVYEEMSKKLNPEMVSKPTGTSILECKQRPAEDENEEQFSQPKQKSNLIKKKNEEGEALIDHDEEVAERVKEELEMTERDIPGMEESVFLLQEIVENAGDMQGLCGELAMDLVDINRQNRDRLEVFLHQNRVNKGLNTESLKSLVDHITEAITKHSKKKELLAETTAIDRQC